MSLPKPVIQMGDGFATLMEEYKIKIVNKNQSYMLTIMEGFKFDGASVPKALWSVVGSPWDADILAPALVHDALYATELVNRHEADDIFYKLLKKNGMGTLRAYNRWMAVSMFGWYVWMNHKSATISKARRYVRMIRI